MNIKTPMGLTMDETTYPECDEMMRALSDSGPASGWVCECEKPLEVNGIINRWCLRCGCKMSKPNVQVEHDKKRN